MRRVAIGVVLVILWASFGFGVYHLLESRKSSLASASSTNTPVQEQPTLSLPGAIYVTQAGIAYRFANGRFTAIPIPTSGGAYSQPAAGPGGDLLIVGRGTVSADIFLVDPSTGAIVKQLTHNANRVVELNSWSFWPHMAADGTTLISGWDGPKYGTTYEVHFAVWSGTTTKVDQKQWTNPTLYTGGDAQPVPLPAGGVIYSHYALNGNIILSQIAMVTRPGANPVYLTDPTADCSSPAVNSAGTQVAMICTSNTQTAQLEVMSLTNGVAGKPKVLVPSCLCASPAFSPDGNDLLYLAPVDASGHFQLWWLKDAGTATPAAPKSVTTHLDLDATSAPAWLAS